MGKSVMIAMMFLGMSTSVWAERLDPVHIDKETAKHLLALKEKCKDEKTIWCGMEGLEELDNQGLLRGFESYAEKHYFGLDDEKLKEKFFSLHELRKTARMPLVQKRGEITKRGYDLEISAIQKEWKRRTGKYLLTPGCRLKYPNRPYDHKYLICEQ